MTSFLTEDDFVEVKGDLLQGVTTEGCGFSEIPCPSRFTYEFYERGWWCRFDKEYTDFIQVVRDNYSGNFVGHITYENEKSMIHWDLLTMTQHSYRRQSDDSWRKLKSRSIRVIAVVSQPLLPFG